MPETHVIVGAGQAGGWSALAMREAGFNGRIVLVGDEAERPYERPPLSKAALTGEPAPGPLYFHPSEKYAGADIELMLGRRAEGIDRAAGRIALGNGEWLGFDRLLIATGGRARALPPAMGGGALTLRTLADAEKLRGMLRQGGHVLLIGAGVIGLEVASSARALGRRVTVLEAASTPMGRSVSPEIGALIASLHHDAGVELVFGVGIAAVEGEPGGPAAVTLADGSTHHFDGAVAAVGMIRNDTIASESGIATDNGILVDEFGRSSAENVYAAGDVAAFHHPLYARRLRLESWKHAQNHAIAVARAMCGGTAPYADVPWFWTDQHGVSLQVAGFPAEAAATVMRPGKEPSHFTALHVDGNGRLVAASSIGAPRDVRAAQNLIAAGAVIDLERAADPTVPVQKLALG